ncbi:alpha-1A adrenergic receptor-like, partial [Dendronephthya gigantea]|uniref:alpha-1A adrenergic receptor-like n=1 Tax=Dendronephthya gigantea TaxID=151771 RepID=UPI001069141B
MISTPSYDEDGRDHEYFRSICLILMILSFIFLFVGVLGNTAVIFYNICLNNERTLSSWLVTNLAIADLLVCLTIYPKTIIRYFLVHKKYDDVFHKFSNSTLHFSLFLSTTLLLSITVDRYVFIAKPLRYPIMVTTRRVKAVLCVIWLTATVQLPIVYIFSKEHSKLEIDFVRSNAIDLFLLSRVILLSIPIDVTAILNYKLLKIVQRKWRIPRKMMHPEQEDHEQMPKRNVAWLRELLKQMKAIKTFTIIFGVLTICFLPYFVVMTL